MWAWACTVVHMATGTPPFFPLSRLQIIFDVGARQKAPDIPNNLPDFIQELLDRCFLADPSQRPAAKQALQVGFEPATRSLPGAEDGPAPQ
jgi:serine/threonine protein kinase